MLVAKVLFNSVIPTKVARFMTMNISKFYLMTPLLRPEYIHISIKDIPDEIIQEYDLKSINTEDGMITSKPIAACTVYRRPGFWPTESSKNDLTNAATIKVSLFPGLWKHEWRPV